MPNTTTNRIERNRQNIIRFLQIVLEGEGPYQWSPDISTTKIVITGDKPEAIVKEHSKPFLSIDIGGIRGLKRGLGNLITEDIETRVRTVGDLIRQDVRITVGSQAPDEVSELGWFLMWVFPTFAGELDKTTGLRMLGNASISDETQQGAFSPDRSGTWVGRIFVQPCLAWETFNVKMSATDPFSTTIDQIRVEILERMES